MKNGFIRNIGYWFVKKDSVRLALLKSVSMRALQSQINPHFLYNTLETINWTAMKLNGRDNPVSQMVLALSQILRISPSRPKT